MKQEDKELLLKDLSARLPYEVQIRCSDLEVGDDNLFTGNWIGSVQALFGINLLNIETEYTDACPIICVDEEGQESCYSLDEVKPYLRPVSSMTPSEQKEFRKLNDFYNHPSHELIDFYNSHHLDYRSLISKGLALEAKEGMYA